MKPGLLLYGPPASGKNTISDELASLDARYRLFQRLKIGSGRTSGYRMGTAPQLARLRADNDVLYENGRYGNTYVVDRPGLDDAFRLGVPVLHLGQIAGIHALHGGYPARWATVLLWCRREATQTRSVSRGDADTPARLAAWDATKRDLDAHPGTAWDLVVDTAETPPGEAARLINQLLTARPA